MKALVGTFNQEKALVGWLYNFTDYYTAAKLQSQYWVQLISLVNQKKSHNTIIRVCACVWSRLQAPLHRRPISQQLITKQTSPLMSFVLAWSDDISVDLSDLISYLLKKKQNKTQNNNPIYCWCSIPQPLPPKKRAWSACHCQYLIPVLKFFAHLKKVSSFQWISISETIWIDRTEAEKYLSASRQKRAIEIYLYKNRHRHTPINIFWQLKFNDLENVKIESFRLV